MEAGKAIYYLLANNENITTEVGTRIYPELAPQDAALPFIFFEVVSVDPDGYKDGPAAIDEVRIEVSAVADTYDSACTIGSKVRGALDRIYGTYNSVNVESIEFTDVDIVPLDKPRRYICTYNFTMRIIRGAFDLATGSPITGYLLGQLNNVTLSDELDRQALVYDEASGNWINDGVQSIVIPVKNLAPTAVPIGTIVKAITTQGDRIVISAYSAGDDPKLLLGCASENIAGGADGHIQVYGELRAVDTSAYTLGTILYPGSSGAFSTTADQYNIAIGIVTRVHANTGRIFLRTWTPGQVAGGGSDTLEGLSDVTITSPADGHRLLYDETARAWVNAPVSIPSPPPDTTDQLTEGTTNLYFTDARAQAAVSSSTIVRSVNGEVGDQEGDVSLDTSHIAESTNLYYTDARADARIAASSVTAHTDVTNAGSGAIITTAERSKLAGIAAGAEVNVNADWNAATGDAAILNKPTIPTELGDLGGNADEIAEGQTNLFFTSAERSKLSGIAAGAEVNVNADWNAASGDAAILNKPTIPSAIGDLSDVPASLGTAGQVLAVNAGATALEYINQSGGTASDADVGQAWKTTDQTLSGSFAAIASWDTESYDDISAFNPTTGELTITQAGHYLIIFEVHTGITDASTTRSESQIYLDFNGSEVGGSRRGLYNRTAGADEASASISTTYKHTTGTAVFKCMAGISNGTSQVSVINASMSYASLGGAQGVQGVAGNSLPSDHLVWQGSGTNNAGVDQVDFGDQPGFISWATLSAYMAVTYDSGSNEGTGERYVVPTTGLYEVNGFCAIYNAGTLATDVKIIVTLEKNSTANVTPLLARTTKDVAASNYDGVGGTAVMQLTAGDTIAPSLYIYRSGTGGDLKVVYYSTYIHFAIRRIA